MKYYHLVRRGESKTDFYFYLKDGKLHIFGSPAKGILDPVVQQRIEEICHAIGCTYEVIDTGGFMNQIILTRMPNVNVEQVVGDDLGNTPLEDAEYLFFTTGQ